MNYVNFDTIKDELKPIYLNSMEHYWYEKAWSVLTQQNLTSFKNTEEYSLVCIRALTLAMIYSEFCDICFGELTEYGCCDYKFEDEIEDIILGQLYGRFTCSEVSTSRNYLLCCLADSQRNIVLSALLNEMSDVELLAGMYYARYNGISFSDDDDECYECHKIDSYLEYWEYISNNIGDLINDMYFSEDMSVSAYEWINQGAPTLRSFYNEDSVF